MRDFISSTDHISMYCTSPFFIEFAFFNKHERVGILLLLQYFENHFLNRHALGLFFIFTYDRALLHYFDNRFLKTHTYWLRYETYYICNQTVKRT